MIKILTHVSQQHEYRSLIRALFDNKNDIEILSANVHNNLFDIYNQTKPSCIILPTSEYTQEFHDFVNEYHTNLKIILFINNIIDNNEILHFFNNTKVHCVGRRELIKNIENLDNTDNLYNRLYDNNIFYRYDVQNDRNHKIAVLLSSSNEKNDNILDNLLYPKTDLPLVLFNSASYKKYQNIGYLSPNDTSEVFNTYKAILDIDNEFLLEAEACGVPSISLDGDILENINSLKKKTYNANNIEKNSYDFFVKNTLISLIERK